MGPGLGFLALAIVGAGGVLWWVWWDDQRAKRLRAEAEKEAVSGFRARLIGELRAGSLDSFQLDEFARSCEVPPEEAVRIARELYGSFARKVVADGVITEAERGHLDRLARALEIDRAEAARLESGAKADVYREAATSALSDGVLGRSEAMALETLRRNLGLSHVEAYDAASDVQGEAYVALVRRLAMAGSPSRENLRYLDEFKKALLVSHPAARDAVRPRMIDLFREVAASVVADGEVTKEERQLLDWLQNEAQLLPSDVEPMRARVERVASLGEIRRGRLPVVATRKLLEGAEVCHWEGHATYWMQTPGGRLQTHDGALIVTSKFLNFTSPTRSFQVAPSKIIDLSYGRGCLKIQTATRSGSGDYVVSDPEYLEAVLCGVVRKHKYMLSEGFSTVRSRHIPPEVKREVYARDNGRCVQCGAADYLEFDHIIPHAKGGANTVGNVQLLCRRCNSAKGDRIG